MKHIVNFSGGKDSAALILWAKESLAVFTVVHCKTKWEHPITDAYVEYINQTLLRGELVYLQSEKYPDGFEQLVIERKMFPGVKSRFCTEELKVFPLHAFYESLDDDVTAYQGVRAEESESRSKMPKREWVDAAGGYWIERPLLNWTARECFARMAKYEVKPNPLYLMGAKRVGCWPCIMMGLGEIRRALKFFPELKSVVLAIELKANESARNDPGWKGDYKTWFRSDRIPARFCSQLFVAEDGRKIPIPTAEDVFRYIESVDEDQLPMFPARSCMSVYNLCE